MSSYLVMALSALLGFVFSLYVSYIGVARGKPASPSGSNWKGKSPLDSSDNVVIAPPQLP